MSRRKNDLSQRLEAVIKTLVPQQEQNPDDLGPMMRAIKAVHSISDHTSTTPEDLERQRAAEELFARLVTPGIGIRSDSLTVGSIPAEWVSLEHGHDRRHAVLYCHGGGYTCGQLGYARILASKLALATGFDVLSFEYRLAPEHPFPAAIEDAVAMWDYLMYMGYGARDIIVAGDSAGGNLALELALKLKDQGRAQPRGLVLLHIDDSLILTPLPMKFSIKFFLYKRSIYDHIAIFHNIQCLDLIPAESCIQPDCLIWKCFFDLFCQNCNFYMVCWVKRILLR